MRYFLIGYMGAGKTTLGRRLAGEWTLPFVDLDEAIEQESGMSIRSYFESHGEKAFRALEHDVLQRTIKDMEGFVMACGGGTACSVHAMDLMKSSGLVVFLDVPVPELVHRLREQKGHRPLLQGISDEQLEAFITVHLNERKKWYRQAHLVVSADEMEEQLKRWQRGEH